MLLSNSYDMNLHQNKILVVLTFCLSCTLYAQSNLVDDNATRQTKNLHDNLKQQAQRNILFGHQDALAYGVNWKNWHKKKSDVKDVCGKYPAVFGWDIARLGKTEFNIDTVDFEQMKAWIIQAYKIGGINTISWHMDNFVTGGDTWDVGERVVATILPGGENHQSYLRKLDLFCDFLDDLEVGWWIFKKKIPIIFRPFHEHTGGWFWWGKPYATVEEYKALWQFTVQYLRDKKGVHQLLYAYSTDRFDDKAHYLEYYPGDEWVDILGHDNYGDFKEGGSTSNATRQLRQLVEMADKRDKIAALTETGFESIPQADWWTEVFWRTVFSDPVGTRIAYAMVWRNARTNHHYAPYPGHSSSQNFILLSQHPMLLFAGDLSNPYR